MLLFHILDCVECVYLAVAERLIVAVAGQVGLICDDIY